MDVATTAQRVFYFPLRTKLEALLRLPSYKKMIQHEFNRPRNNNFMSDVYDSPAWQKFMGPPVYPNNRMGACMLCYYLLCLIMDDGRWSLEYGS